MEIMAQEKEHKNIQPEWKEVGIKDICESITDCINKTAPTVEYPTPYKMIRTNNVRNGQIDLLEVKYVTKEIFEIWTRRIIPKKGDIILTREAPLGEVGMIKTDDHIFLGQRLMQYRTDPCYLDNRFLLYAFQDRTLREQIRLLGSGATVEHMKVPDAEKLILQLPPLPEQHAIVTALSDVDALIASLDKLIAKKRDIKQATMQQLLTGKIRLPGFSGEWEVKRLNEECELITKGTTPTSLGKNFSEQGINFIKVESLTEEGTIIWDKLAFIDEETHNLLRRSQLRNKDILFSIAGALGRTAIVKQDILPANTNQALALIRLKDRSCLNHMFLTKYLTSPEITKHIELINVQAAQANLSLGDIRNFIIKIPSLPEQTAIASVLSDMDAETVALEQKREKTRMLKQGMMQELLTGKIRLL